MKKNWHPDMQITDIWTGSRNCPVILYNNLSLAPGGSFVVYKNYILAFVKQRPLWKFIVLNTPYHEGVGMCDLGSNVCFLNCGQKTLDYARRYIWERKWLGKISKNLCCDIYFSSGVYHPCVKIPQFIFVQDPATYILKQKSLKARARAILLRRYRREAVKKATCVGYTSNYMRSLIIKDARNRAEKNYVIAYNGIDKGIQKRASKPFFSLAQRQPFILCVSSINPHKNFEVLIRALRILREKTKFENYALKIMGRLLNNVYLEYLHKVVETQKLTNAVTFELDRPWNNLALAYESASLFSLTSLCESFGIPIIEAMAHGVPIVAGNSTAIPEICGDAAVLIPPDNPHILADAWANILSNASKYVKLQNAGRYRALKFDWDKSVGKWIKAMEDVLD